MLIAACREQVPWRQVAPEGGRFRVAMPVEPRAASQTSNTAWGPLQARFYEAEVSDGAVVLSVSYTDYPVARFEPDKAAALLREAQSTTVMSVAGVVSAEGSTPFEGWPARQTSLRAASGVEYQLLVVLAGSRLYQVMTASRPGKLSAGARAKFFGSFHLDGDAIR